MQECPTCGSLLRFGRDPHLCKPHHTPRVQLNPPRTREERLLVSESVRQVYHIPELFWYRNRPEDLEIVRQLRAESST